MSLFNIPNPPVTPKCHWLMDHVAKCASHHNLWGIANEQPVENLHSVINEDRRRFCAVKDQETLFLQVVRLQDLRNFYFDNK